MPLPDSRSSAGDTINPINRDRPRRPYPTTMLQRVLAAMLLRHQPGWVVFFAGANDILRYGARAASAGSP
jgi:hypothetical protein